MSKINPFVQTVLGPIPSSELGLTLAHEHFFCGSAASNLAPTFHPHEQELAYKPVSREIREWLEFNWHSNLDNLTLDNVPIACEEAGLLRRAGGRSVIDVTSRGISRNPQGLVAVSRASGLHIVMGCGYYVAATHTPEVATMTRAQIADQIVTEFALGVDDTGVKPGVIGEIGCSWPITEAEAKCLRGACDAQKELGAALYIHPGKHPGSPAQILDVLKDTPVDLSRTIFCHIERTVQDFPALVELLRTGVVLEYDLFGLETTAFYYRPLKIDIPSDAQRLNQIRQLIDAGFQNQILMSHDICFKHRLHHYGGHGYEHIVTNTIPWMRQRGFSGAEIEGITVGNPRRLIELKAV